MSDNPNTIKESDIPDSWHPVDAAPIIPGTPAVGAPPAPINNRLSSAPILQDSFGLQTDVASNAAATGDSYRLFPAGGSAQANAKSAGIAQALINKAIANLPTPTPTPVTPATFDPSDASIAWWRDDFKFGTATGNTAGQSTLGELHWDSITGGGGFPGGAAFVRVEGNVYHPGMIQIFSGTTTNTSSAIFNPFGSTVETGNFPLIGGNFQAPMPLLDNPGWKMTYIFGFPANRLPATASPFPVAKASFYCGLTTGVGVNTWTPNGNNNRPDYFVGLRFDNDPGVSLSLTSVNNTSGGATIYNGTITGGTGNAFVGVKFTIAGFLSPTNNGTFVCISSSNTTLTLLTTGGVAETHAATATSPSIADTTFKFEMVSNNNINTNRNNTQGTVVDTGITPAELAFYRLDMECISAGVVTLTLSNGTTQFTTTFSPVLKTTSVSSGGSGGLDIDFNRQNGLGQIVQSTAYTTGEAPTSNLAFTIGSIVTITGAPQSFYDGTFRITGTPGNGTNYTFVLAGGTDSSAGSTATLTGYPGLMPYFSFGNDSEATPLNKTIAIDFFSLVLNPALAGLTNNPTFPRFFYAT